MHKLYELKETLIKELERYADNQTLDLQTLDVIDKLAHAGKNVCNIIEACEEEQYSEAMGGGSYRSMPHFRMAGSYANDGSYGSYGSYARGRGSNARRDSMGRYSSAGDFRADLQDLMNSAPNEQVRQKLMETMNMM